MKTRLILILALVSALAAFGLALRKTTPPSNCEPAGNDCQYDPNAIKGTDTNLLRRTHATWIKPASTNLTALAVDRAGRIIVGSMYSLEILDQAGKQLSYTPLPEPVRCLATSPQGTIFAGLNDHVEVFDAQGVRQAVWQSPNPKSMLTSIAVSSNLVFVADCANRLVWRFTLAGELLGPLGANDTQRPEGFVVPSAFFDLAVAAYDSLWVVNPGQHRLEHFTPSGEFIEAWGTYAMEPAGFCGCCNPSNMALTPAGEFITSEKHIVRVKQYAPDGKFKSIISGHEDWAAKAVGLDLAVDTQGRILVLDPTADIVRIFQPQ